MRSTNELFQDPSAKTKPETGIFTLPAEIIIHSIFAHLGRCDSFSLFNSCRFFRTSRDFWLAIKDKPAEILIALGYNHSLIYDRAKNMLYSYGENTCGQLGLGSTTIDQYTPQPVLLPKDKHIQRITAGLHHSIIQFTDASVYSCGKNDYGQLGLGHYDHQNTLQPMDLPKGKDIQHIAAGTHTLILFTDGTLYSCGENAHGQLGLGNTTHQNTLQSVDLPKEKHVQHVAAGVDHTIMLCTDGTLYSWGGNSGQLGLGHKSNQLTPKQVTLPADKRVQHIAAGYWHTIILCTDGTLYTCGSNILGELGLDHDECQVTPQLVTLPDGKQVQHMAAGDHTLILFTDGTLYSCGGNDYGQLGLGHDDHQNALQPVTLPGGKPVQHIAAGYGHTFILCTDGTLHACGNNKSGQLGVGGLDVDEKRSIDRVITPQPVTLPEVPSMNDSVRISS